jgi:spermidine/putrescine transport system permease protein
VSVAASKTGGRLLGGYFVLLAIFLYAPLAVMIIFAFDDSFVQTLPWSGFTTKWFHNAFSNEELIGALERSLWIGILAAILATLLGLITAVGMLILLNWLGLQRTLFAVLLGHVAVSVPYCLLIILPRLRTLDQAIVDAARDLGASPWTAFRRVTLPLVVPALFASALIAFTISFDEFAIASFLVPPGEPTYPVYVYTGARTPALQPQILALGSVVVVASLVIVTLAEVFRTRAERRLAI